MAISPFVRPLGFAAACLGIIQGIVWSIFGLIVILIYLNAWPVEYDLSTYGHHLNSAIYLLYLDAETTSDLLVVPLVFFACGIIYLIWSVFWLLLSSYQLWVLMEKKDELVKNVFVGWSYWTLLVCIFDCVLMCVLAVDYNTLIKAVNANQNATKEEYMLVLACGIVMTLIARGFVLWVINLTLCILIMKLSFGIPKKMPKNDVNSNVIDAFATTAPQRTWEPDKPNFARSNSFVSSQSFGTFHGLPRLPPVQSANERLTKLNKQIVMPPPSPAHNTSPSYLYSSSSGFSNQNYSAPAQPPLKSALKNREPASYG